MEEQARKIRKLLFGVLAVLIVVAVVTLRPRSPQEIAADPEAATLDSVTQIDDHPLYVLHYYADYRSVGARMTSPRDSGWACSLFAALGDPETLVYGRNFDWEHSPAVLLFTDPPDGYASVSLVNLYFLGFNEIEARNLAGLPLIARRPLLEAPFLPIDGMNETGLVIGMAAVPDAELPADSDRPVIGSLGIMREVLDYAATVDEALAIFDMYTIDFTGGPQVHYLIADANGDAILIEYDHRERQVMRNENLWLAATNFLANRSGEGDRSLCDRYRIIAEELTEAHGATTVAEALSLLEMVAQMDTQWSVVYGINDLSMTTVMHGAYDTVYIYSLDTWASYGDP
ncbi:MAG: linear amide C-N hydrolase [Anaerolineae bacterium]|nr:linear amide C-N hydrolase [Anaerolineae bacterium]